MASSFRSFKWGKNGSVFHEMSVTEMLTTDIIGKLIGIAVMLLCIGLLAAIVPFFMFIIYSLSDQKRYRTTANWVGLVAGIYLIFDYTHGWIALMILDVFLSPERLQTFTAINLSLTVVHLAMLIVSPVYFRQSLETNTHNWITENENNLPIRVPLLVGSIIVFIFIFWKFAPVLLEHNIHRYKEPEKVQIDKPHKDSYWVDENGIERWR
jgi:hypothetical protein